ncbi:MAG: peptidoglycan bridge formation glycyltransferase FemA/FemB family protein [Candidatus Nealsonbacteria bacterium]|nr:peptidoglycan bridge formation glycyltransferase FemA/FemB family protein [Candidatus Nealsonbacteria bacterium]
MKFERYMYDDKALLSMARVGDKLISHPFCEYGGPLPLLENIDAEKFKQDLLSEFKNRVRINFHPQLARTFLALDGARSVLDQSGRVSYFLEDIDLRKTTRHEIEKAKANNIQVEKCQSQKDLKNFYNLYLKSAKRHKIPAYPFSFFDYFFNSNESEIILAKKNNLVIAGSAFLFYEKFVHYFQNAIDEKYKNLGANYLILWEQIQKSLQDNKIFDFGGTRIGSPLQIFKQGWGGREYPIFELTNCGGTMKSGLPGKLDFETLRNIFGLLPPFLIKKLSPYLLKYKL